MPRIRLIDSGRPTRWLLFAVVLASVALAAYPLLFGSPRTVYGIGTGCEDAPIQEYFDGDEVSYTVPDVESGQVIAAVCIGYGEGHSEKFASDGALEAADSCFDSNGIGTVSVTVTFLSDDEFCIDGAEHIDVYLSELPTPTPTPTPTLTPSPTPTLTPTPTPSPTPPPACSDASLTVAAGGGGQATYTAPAGQRITSICVGFSVGELSISSGDGPHTGKLFNGPQAGGCLFVAGVGTRTVSVFLSPAGTCPVGIDHIDVYQVPVPPTPTPSPAPPTPPPTTPTATATTSPTATPTATVTAAATATATPTVTATASPSATAVPTTSSTATGTPSGGSTPPEGTPGGQNGPSNPGGPAGGPGTTGGAGGTGASGTVAGTPVSTATSTPSPTPTSTPTSTPTRTPTPTPTPRPTDTPTAAAVGVPTPPDASSGSGNFRPAFAISARDVSDTDGHAEVMLTNLLLAIVLVLLVLFDASIINSTVEENHEFFEPWIDRVTGPARGVFHQLGFVVHRATGNWTFERLTRYTALLSLTSLVYALLDPDFGLNQATFVLLLSLIIGIGFMTVTFDGVQVWLARRRYGLAAGILFFPFAIVLAIGSVLISRLFDVHPGIIYGFVAAAALMPGQEPSEGEEGQLIYLPMLVMFACSLLSWVLVAPFRAWAEDGSFFGALLESVAVAIFVGGVQGLLFTLVPIEFMDGQKVWKWSRVAWFSIAVPVTFVFLHVLMNPQGDFGSPIQETSLKALFVLCVAVWLATATVWLYFRRRKGRMEAA